MLQLESGSNWYGFLSNILNTEKEGDESQVSQPVEESALSKDEMLKEIIEHKRKILSSKPYISLSNAVTTTLAAASIAQNVESSIDDQLGTYPVIAGKYNVKKPDSTVFTCSHNLPRYYMLETVVPEFQSRMGELPEPLVYTAEIMTRFYTQYEMKIPMACPYCVYNNLRNEQLHVLRETGVDAVNNRSSVWEI